MQQVRNAVRRFVDEGLHRQLAWFLVVACVVAFVASALFPPGGRGWFPLRIPDDALFAASLALSLAWLGVFAAALIRCGWPGLVLLISVKWAISTLCARCNLLGLCRVPRVYL